VELALENMMVPTVVTGQKQEPTDGRQGILENIMGWTGIVLMEDKLLNIIILHIK
jgi:hypothetical protein